MQVLVVDDDPLVRKSLNTGFSREGHATLDAPDGLSAFKILEKQKVDLIVSDILMPELDGYGLCHAVRNRKSGHDVPFILYSGTFLGKDDKELAYQVGADRYVEKPASFETILKMAEEVTANRNSKDTRHSSAMMEELQLLKKFNQLLTVKINTMRKEKAASAHVEQRREEEANTSQKMESIGKLASGVAHDFNNFLSIVLTYARFIKKNKDATPQILEDAEEIEKAGVRSARLTKQLLAFSRKEPFQPRVFSPCTLIQEMETLLKPLIGENIILKTAVAPDVGQIKADPSQLEQIIMNLAVNARDAMPTGGHLSLGIENHDVQGEPWVMISVKDTGSGMSEETLSRIFEPFFTTKPKDQGTGLGLSIVDRLIQQNGGKVMADSKLNEGTVFKILLPRIKDFPQN